MGKRELFYRNMETGEEAGRFDVTGHSERSIERIMRGMLINKGDDWVVCDTEDDDPIEVNP